MLLQVQWNVNKNTLINLKGIRLSRCRQLIVSLQVQISMDKIFLFK